MRKFLDLSAETLDALRCLAKSRGRSVDALVEEALGLLFRKHHHPRTLREALTFSLRQFSANDNETGNVKKVR
jgi:hypothetical protein